MLICLCGYNNYCNYNWCIYLKLGIYTFIRKLKNQVLYLFSSGNEGQNTPI